MTGLIAHLTACVLYVALNYYCVTLYKHLAGGLTSRDVAIGIAMYLIFYFFIFMNALIAFIPKVKIKLIFVFLMMGLILFYLLPQHPVRAMFYSMFTGSLTVIAVIAAKKLEQLFISLVGPAQPARN